MVGWSLNSSSYLIVKNFFFLLFYLPSGSIVSICDVCSCKIYSPNFNFMFIQSVTIYPPTLIFCHVTWLVNRITKTKVSDILEQECSELRPCSFCKKQICTPLMHSKYSIIWKSAILRSQVESSRVKLSKDFGFRLWCDTVSNTLVIIVCNIISFLTHSEPRDLVLLLLFILFLKPVLYHLNDFGKGIIFLKKLSYDPLIVGKFNNSFFIYYM